MHVQLLLARNEVVFLHGYLQIHKDNTSSARDHRQGSTSRSHSSKQANSRLINRHPYPLTSSSLGLRSGVVTLPPAQQPAHTR